MALSPPMRKLIRNARIRYDDRIRKYSLAAGLAWASKSASPHELAMARIYHHSVTGLNPTTTFKKDAEFVYFITRHRETLIYKKGTKIGVKKRRLINPRDFLGGAVALKRNTRAMKHPRRGQAIAGSDVAPSVPVRRESVQVARGEPGSRFKGYWGRLIAARLNGWGRRTG
jgi:hypothetical protein